MTRIECLKAKARQYNRQGDWFELRQIIDELDLIWADDLAALAFYTKLERAAIEGTQS